MHMRRRRILALIASALTTGAWVRSGGGEVSTPSVSSTEIRLGQTIAYSGPASSLGTIGRTAAGYYRMINDRGGINGRRVRFISVDDGYNPAQTVEQTRRLVEEENVLAMVGSVGAPTSASVQRYLNQHHVPQLFLIAGAARFSDPEHFPWTMPLVLSQQAEARFYARNVIATKRNARIGVLYQNDDLGKDYLHGFRIGLGGKQSMIVAEASYEITDPTVDSQIIALESAGVDVLFDVAIPKFAAQAIRKAYDIDWHPMHILIQPAASIAATLRPAGFGRSIGVIAADYLKLPDDPAWADDPEVIAYRAFLKQYAPDTEAGDRLNMVGYYNAAAVCLLLARCGDEVTRENLMFQATHMKDVRVPGLLPGIAFNTSPTDYVPIKQLELQRFDGKRWIRFGGIIQG
jgi:branched-chain amino acid transport system substrate-binding protein